MFFFFFYSVLNLDLGWFVWVVSANIIYLFAFLAVCFFFWDRNIKKTIAGTILLSIVAWMWVDFEIISGWVLFVGGFLAIYYVTKFAALTFAEDIPSLQNKLVIVSEIQFIVLLIVYNLFLR